MRARVLALHTITIFLVSVPAVYRSLEEALVSRSSVI